MSHRPRPPLDQTDSRLEFETLISDTSAALMTAAPERVERVIEEALGRVREFFLGDRCALLEISDDRQVARVRMASYAAGVDPVPSSMNLSALFPWAAKTLFQDRAPISISRMADLPPVASGDRPGWVRLGIRSALALPVEMFPEVRHVIVVQSIHEEIEWPEPLVTRLRILGELLVGSLRWNETMVELREAEARLTLAADSAEAGLWTLDRDTGAFWLTDRSRNLFGFSPVDVITLARFESALHPDDRDAVRSAFELAYR
jgi:PAS domain-containing protein